MKRTVVAQQGEVKVFKITALPIDMKTKKPTLNKAGAAIISHSERGHNHVVAGAEVMERVDNVPAGMQIFYAICKDPTSLKQDAPTPHDEIKLDGGSIYEFRVSREFNPFLEEARKVHD